MKKLLIFTVVFISIQTAKAQSYLGYYYDNYAGVQSTLYNPASIVDSRFRTDINLFSASAFLGNDYYGVKAFDLLKDGYNFEREAKKFASGNNNFVINVDIMGPSFMFNLAPKHSLAIFTRGRAIGNVRKIDGNLVNQVADGLNSNQDFRATSQNAAIVANSWAEFGISYATILLNKNQHFLKGGLSLKYLQGFGNAYIKADNVTFDYDFVNATGDGINNPINTAGTVTYGGTQDIENKKFKISDNSKGIGADLGFVYEYRPNYNDFSADDKDLNKYKLRLGLSVTDIGSINYKDGSERVHTLGTPSDEKAYNDAGNSTTFLNLYPTTKTNSSASANLPTALHVNLDWNMYKKFYLNVNGDVSLINQNSVNSSSIANAASLTPRYERKWFSAYLPISYVQYSELQAGFGFRAGPIFVGSGSVISNLVSKESKSADIHFGLKIPVYQGRKKDKDGDGILDKVDDCPDIAGPAENKGCPWKDKDRDGIYDKDDKCPDIAGPKENKGCPWEDSDKDGVLDKDDKCPKVAGEKANDGCPWDDSDKDGVFDKDDKCPKVFGVASNKGCPEEVKKEEPKAEIKQDVIKKINAFSKTILFDTGKATIKSESFNSLDAIVAVLNEYSTANFKVEGHTDSAGKPASNLKLSKERAAAVKKYFVDKGINASRLTSEGYGSKKPIASNKTAKGKNLNRRVEINLVN
jgi:outer membrane protein OmpA-like peptidoglycan-associated protein